MKKTIFLIITLLLVAVSVNAAEIENPLKAKEFEEILNTIINFIFAIGLAVTPVIFIIAGFLFVTSGGNPNRLDTAKKMILYAVIGLLVILLAKGLVAVLKSILGAEDPTAFLFLLLS
ncbi:MAG: TrbC/VirB2 family protein [Candidatus Nealsonbacteria bacterium]